MKKVALIAALLVTAPPSLADERLRTYHSLKLANAGIAVPLSLPALARYGQLDVQPSGGVHANIQPTLAYDSNLNGGVPHEKVDINGLEFTVPVKDRAVSGLEAGLVASVGGQYQFSRGHRVSGAIIARYEHALSHDLSNRSVNVNTCYHYDSPDWSYAEACLNTGRSRGELSKTTTRSLRVNWGKLLDVGHFPSTIQFGVSRTDSTDAHYDQLHMTYKTNTEKMTFEAGIATKLRSEGFSEDHSGYFAITRPVLGRPISATLRHSQSSGSKFLGLPRKEEKTAISLIVPMSSSLSLDLSFAKTRSNLDYFRKQEFGANFVWRRF